MLADDTKTVLLTLSMLFLYTAVLAIVEADASAENLSVQRFVHATTARVGEPTTVTLRITNHGSTPMRGFYFAEHVPAGLRVDSLGAKIAGGAATHFILELSDPDAVYAGRRTHRWVLETPPGFPEHNEIGASETLEIVYTWTAERAGRFRCDEFSWVCFSPRPPQRLSGIATGPIASSTWRWGIPARETRGCSTSESTRGV